MSQNLEITNPDALLREQQRLTGVPELQRWCERTCDGANSQGVLKALVTLMMYTHTGTLYENPAAMLEPTLGSRQNALATVAAHLSSTSAETLRQTVHLNAEPNLFSPYLTDFDRLCLAAELCRHDGDVQVSAGNLELAAAHYKTGAQVLEPVAGQKTPAAQLYLQCANALKQANQHAAAAPFYLQAGALEFSLIQTLSDQVDPREIGMRAAAAFAAAATMFSRVKQPRQAIDANKRAAEAFNCVRMLQPAAGLYRRIAEDCTQLAIEYTQAGQHALADAATMEATDANGNAASACFELKQFEEAARLFSGVGQHTWAATCYDQLVITHQRAGDTERATEYLLDAARARAQAGQHDQAHANFWQAADIYRRLNRLEDALAAELAGTDEQVLAEAERADVADQEQLAAQAEAARQAQWQQLVTSFGGPPEPAVVRSINKFIGDHLDALAGDGVTLGSYKFQMDNRRCCVSLEDFDPLAEYGIIIIDPRNADGTPRADDKRTVKFIEISTAQDMVKRNSKHINLPGPMRPGDILRGQALLDLLPAQPPAQQMDGGGAAPLTGGQEAPEAS
ncbi:soluble NSF attachment family protein [Pandoraea sputorum]|uniref:Tetratricopeptide repeat protein n=1 Tax=Pandoraea sputorum TaxID=93222 RepID=A0A5E5BN56_9BURK|nr:hypothetical protein [Pandoraea sputorum]VVE85923.1 hypothetical protein PSP31121_05556 [Pandoraea sputorum]